MLEIKNRSEKQGKAEPLMADEARKTSNRISISEYNCIRCYGWD